MVKDPSLIYPGQEGYPTGGPGAALGLPVPRPGFNFGGNPDYKEGDTPSGVADAEDLELYKAYAVGGSSPEKDAAYKRIMEKIGYPGSNADMGTDANKALAHWLAKACGHM